MTSFYVGDDDGQNQFDFGSTAGFHQGSMSILWIPGANIAIILIIYAYRKYWVWLHMAFFAIATIITLASSFPILSHTGLIPSDSTVDYDDYSASTLRTHYILGIVACSLVALVSLLGGLTKLLNVFNAKSNAILYVRRIHTWSGYAAVLACKANVYVLGLGGWLAVDIICLLIYVFWGYVFFPKLEGKHISPKYKEEVKAIKSVKELDQSQNYVTFANNVYDIKPLRYNHPAGYQIVEVLKNKEVDRYIYGSCVADQLPEVRMWSHSFRSFTLMGDPVARLSISSTFEGYDMAEVECEIPKVHMISQKGSIYQINLKKKYGSQFKFTGYRDITQLGRYFSITLNDKVTRLYTTVNFLVEENTLFMEKHCPGYKAWIDQNGRLTPATAEESHLLNHRKTKLSEEVLHNEEQQHTDRPVLAIIPDNPENEQELKVFPPTAEVSHNRGHIPILFKTYAGGKFSEGIVKGPVNKVVISEEKGEGLELAHTKPGKIIFVAGGTGIYPFSDIIDLLYKEGLMLEQPKLRGEIVALSPILESDPFKNFTFEMLAAFQHIEDMHPITFDQLMYLTEKGRIKLTMKLRQNPLGRVRQGNNLSFTSSPFQDILADKLNKGDVSRVWICGPPGMNIMVSKFLRQTYKDPNLYLIV